MEQRLKIKNVLPQAWKGMYDLSMIQGSKPLSKTHRHLIMIRASQLNKCAYCIDMHTKEARGAGETEQRINLISVWRDTDLFTNEEKSVLAVAEEITLVSQHGLSNESYANARQYFDEEYLAQIIMAAIIMNMWNRVAISNKLEIAS